LTTRFAKKYDAENLTKLREGVQRDLENELKYSQARAVRGQIIHALLTPRIFDLPETAVAHETRNVGYDIVRENNQRGVARDLIEKQKDEIYSARPRSAKERVKLSFLIQRIAEKESIQVSQDEVFERAQSLARRTRFHWRNSSRTCRTQRVVELYDKSRTKKCSRSWSKKRQIGGKFLRPSGKPG